MVYTLEAAEGDIMVQLSRTSHEADRPGQPEDDTDLRPQEGPPQWISSMRGRSLVSSSLRVVHYSFNPF